MVSAKEKPADVGYRFPAEWEPHEATWLSWPHEEGISFPDSYEQVLPIFRDLVAGIAASELVRINVKDAAEEQRIRKLLSRVPDSRVQYFHFPAYEPWCRDHGPIFLVRNETPRLAVVDWAYNAWGGKYPPYDKDDEVPTRIAEHFQLPVYYPGIIMEGGSLDGNGAGTLLTTESCLLNPNRNPHLSKAQIEDYLRDYLGAKQIVWLGDGIEGDDTDGHVDDITRFVSEDTVVTVIEENPEDPNHEPLRANLQKLRETRLLDGRPLKVVTMPMPGRIDREDLRLPASYANFYITNGAILLPVFQDPNDVKVIAILSDLFPTRQILPINCRELIWGLGAFHCLTQQQPRV